MYVPRDPIGGRALSVASVADGLGARQSSVLVSVPHTSSLCASALPRMVGLQVVRDPWDSPDCPRGSDRGAVVTPDIYCGDSEVGDSVSVSLSVHWFEFTVPGGLPQAETFVRALGGGEPLERGGLGYTMGWAVRGKGRVYVAPERPEMGVHVVLSGQVCDELGGEELARLAYMVEVRQGHFSRCDVAMDTNGCSVEDFRMAEESGHVVSRARSGTEYKPFRGSGGHTMTYGRRGSRRLVRVYDKRAERAALGLPCELGTRVEVEHRDEYADTAVLHWLRGGDLRDLVVSAIDVREGEGNVSRRQRAGWWAAVVESAGRVVMVAAGSAEVTIARARQWLHLQVMPTVAWVATADGGDLAWLLHEISEGLARVAPWKLELVRQVT